MPALIGLLMLLAAALSAPGASAQTGPQSAEQGTEDSHTESAEPQRSGSDSGVTTLRADDKHAYGLEVRGPDALRKLLVRHLDLARFREQADISDVEIGRLIAAAPAQAKSLLETEGYFNAQIDARRVEDPAGGAPMVQVQVDPGPQARIGRVQFDMQGAFAEALQAGDPALERRWRGLQARWPLKSGAAFSQAAWAGAKNTLLASLRSRGYASADYAGTGAQVDAKDNTVRLSLVIDSGPLFRIGEVRIEGLERTPQDVARNLIPFNIGDPYSEKILLDYQEALQRTNLYEGVAVELDLDPARAGEAVVLARLRENTLQSATTSIGYSTNTGPRFGLGYTHRRPFGQDVVASARLQVGGEERLAGFDLLGYPQENGYSNLFSLQADTLDAGGARTDTQRARLGRTRATERIDRLYYFEFIRTTLETDTRRTTNKALYGNYEWVRRDVNNIVFPTRGLILSAQAGAGYALDDDDERGPFARLYLQGTWFQPLPRPWLLQVRGEVAQVIKRDSLGVPDALLFRAGGDNSVRGYGYRELGPVRDGAVVGGPVLATGTVEVLRRFSGDWRDWYGAGFIDAGNAANDWGDYEPVFGYGVGVRWRSPIGPLRVDLAYGQEVGSVRLHISVGATF
ncbi:autotransporter assembly complex family protein [Methylibium sp.]|uniref:autotransporter assembly complex protein TamA n=1 Tax=Methylibium sp. TaxID=2067992 RepID=UPI001799FD50|nr:BamA/TamA family outer membrane protein [Methylibium sp.]MBA3589949.1 BamA/TamA family outer membrane protein [Methylibium sp.]